MCCSPVGPHLGYELPEGLDQNTRFWPNAWTRSYNLDMQHKLPPSWLLTMIAAAVLIYTYLVFFVLTDLQSSVGAWIVIFATLVAVLVRRKPGRSALGWIMAGGLITVTNMTVRDFALAHRWPPSQLGTLQVIKHLSLLPAFGCLAMGLVILTRAGQRPRQHPTATTDTQS